MDKIIYHLGLLPFINSLFSVSGSGSVGIQRKKHISVLYSREGSTRRLRDLKYRNRKVAPADLGLLGKQTEDEKRY